MNHARIYAIKRLGAAFMVALAFGASIVTLSLLQPLPANAQLGIEPLEEELDLTPNDPRTVAARIINIFLGFLGLVALVIILLGGFRWMTAQGNEDKVEEAKRILIAGFIGLVIIVSAWAIARYLIVQFMEKGIIR